MMPPILVGPLLQIFFTEYLVAQKRLSIQTIASYRDTFRLLLQFIHRETGIEPVALPVATLDADRVLAFLDGLEKKRHNAITSRNLRLTAIRSFFRMVALREPATVGLATRILAIPMKRTDTGARLRDAPRDGRRAREPESDGLVWATQLRVAAHDVQLWRARVRNRLATPAARYLRDDELRAVAWEGAQGTLDSAVAQDRADLEGMVSRD